MFKSLVLLAIGFAVASAEPATYDETIKELDELQTEALKSYKDIMHILETEISQALDGYMARLKPDSIPSCLEYIPEGKIEVYTDIQKNLFLPGKAILGYLTKLKSPETSKEDKQKILDLISGASDNMFQQGKEAIAKCKDNAFKGLDMMKQNLNNNCGQ